MEERNRSGAVWLLIVLFLVVQVSLAAREGKESAHKVAIDFAKAYFGLDPTMADYICQDQKMIDDIDVTDQHLYLAATDMRQRGMGPAVARSALFNIHTETHFVSDNQAQVHFKARKRTCINPVYTLIARLFNLGGTEEINETITVVKEAGRWKVCGPLFSLPQPV